jgi:cell division FtsZ-interacting protein ZapD
MEVYENEVLAQVKVKMLKERQSMMQQIMARPDMEQYRPSGLIALNAIERQLVEAEESLQGAREDREFVRKRQCALMLPAAPPVAAPARFDGLEAIRQANQAKAPKWMKSRF